MERVTDYSVRAETAIGSLRNAAQLLSNPQAEDRDHLLTLVNAARARVLAALALLEGTR